MSLTAWLAFAAVVAIAFAIVAVSMWRTSMLLRHFEQRRRDK